ncbi:hypothetical protein [Deinococcus sp.]|nr:hypothetical protein [Deinococcus sp.]
MPRGEVGHGMHLAGSVLRIENGTVIGGAQVSLNSPLPRHVSVGAGAVDL